MCHPQTLNISNHKTLLASHLPQLAHEARVLKDCYKFLTIIRRVSDKSPGNLRDSGDVEVLDIEVVLRCWHVDPSAGIGLRFVLPSV